MCQHILVLGVGNILLSDDGLGVHTLRAIDAGFDIPDSVLRLDGGVMGLDLIQHICDCTYLLIIDAIDASLLPGSIVRIEGVAIQMALANKLSIHQLGIQEVLATCRLMGHLPSHIVMIGMQPESINWGLEMTQTVTSRLDHLIVQVIDQLHAWGVTTKSRQSRIPFLPI